MKAVLDGTIQYDCDKKTKKDLGAPTPPKPAPPPPPPPNPSACHPACVAPKTCSSGTCVCPACPVNTKLDAATCQCRRKGSY